MTKKCTICKKDLPATEEYFAGRVRKGKFSFQCNCRECQKQYRKDHYEKNKQKYIDKASVYNRSIGSWFKDIKSKLKCENCGEDRWWVLDFHHKDPSIKEAGLSTLVNRGSKQNIIKEIDKCKVLCSNCHRDLHYKEKQAGNA